MPTTTLITCVTSARSTILPISVAVNVGGAAGGGLALYDAATVFFRYLDRWSAPTTWQYQEPPLAGDTVWVPAGQSILVDVSPPVLNLVLVEGELVFDNKGAWEGRGVPLSVRGGSSKGAPTCACPCSPALLLPSP